MKKRKIYNGLSGLIGLIVLINLIATGCRKAPVDIDEITKEWSVLITAPTEIIYVGDSIALKAELNGNINAQVNFNWIVTDPSNNISYTGNIIKILATKAGDYTVKLEGADIMTGETKSAELKLKVNQRGVLISLSQKGGLYLSEDQLNFDSLEIKFKITAGPDDSLGRFSLLFGDNFILDTVINSAQTVITHKYSDYGTYTVIFINSEIIKKKITIKKPTTPNPTDTTEADTTIIGGDTIITKYDINLKDYNNLSVKTPYPNAMLAKIDSVNNKLYLLYSVIAADRGEISKSMPIFLMGNWAGKDYKDWQTLPLGNAETVVVTAREGKYIKAEISGWTKEKSFEYRLNIKVNDKYINAQPAYPFYAEDLTLDDKSIHIFKKSGDYIPYPPPVIVK